MSADKEKNVVIDISEGLAFVMCGITIVFAIAAIIVAGISRGCYDRLEVKSDQEAIKHEEVSKSIRS